MGGSQADRDGDPPKFVRDIHGVVPGARTRREYLATTSGAPTSAPHPERLTRLARPARCCPDRARLADRRLLAERGRRLRCGLAYAGAGVGRGLATVVTLRNRPAP